ncbi:MAG: FG-GAP repeat protein [Planctomycetota bacterium]
MELSARFRQRAKPRSSAPCSVGARWDDHNGFGSGSAYVFRNVVEASSWVEDAKLIACDGAPWDEFRISVDVSGDTTVIGAWLDGDFSFDHGSA